jgi:hypothetical protein
MSRLPTPARYSVLAGFFGVLLVTAILATHQPEDDEEPSTLPATATPTAPLTTPPPTPRFVTPLPTPHPPAPAWQPALQTSWQWQLNGRIDLAVEAMLYDLELFDTSAQTVATLHARGRRAICYVSVGSWEDWRSDATRFPEAVKGRSNGWPGERWFDIRQLDVLLPLLEARLDQCKARGFDGVEPDNVDGYLSDSGFPLTFEDQLRFNIAIANAARARGLSVGLKNDLPQILDLLPYFDWAMNEQCFEYDECERLRPFIEAGKPVFHVEYRLQPDQFCARANALNFNSLHKRLELDAYRHACR